MLAKGDAAAYPDKIKMHACVNCSWCEFRVCAFIYMTCTHMTRNVARDILYRWTRGRRSRSDRACWLIILGLAREKMELTGFCSRPTCNYREFFDTSDLSHTSLTLAIDFFLRLFVCLCSSLMIQPLPSDLRFVLFHPPRFCFSNYFVYSLRLLQMLDIWNYQSGIGFRGDSIKKYIPLGNHS